MSLQCGQLRGIHIPPERQEPDRSLVRNRKKIWRDLARCKNGIKGFLDYTVVELPDKFSNSNRSKNFLTWLCAIKFVYSSNSTTLNYMIREAELLRK